MASFVWMNYYYQNNPNTYEQVFDDDKEYRLDYQELSVIKQYLLDKGLITYLYDTKDTLTTLKPDGWKWISFDKEFKTEQKEKTKNKIKEFPKLFWFPIAILTYVIGLYTDELKHLLFDKKNNTEKQQIKISNPSKMSDSSHFENLDSSSNKK